MEEAQVVVKEFTVAPQRGQTQPSMEQAQASPPLERLSVAGPS